VPVSVSLGGLSPATSYVYRLVATNSKGTSYGLRQFATTATSTCATDRATVTSDERTVNDEQSTISVQEANVASTKAGTAVSPATVSQDEATVTQDELSVKSDEKALAGTKLIAPISGTITAVNGSVGDSVSGSSSSSTGSGSTGSGSSDTSGGAGSSTTGATSASSTSSSSSTSSTGFVTIENLKALQVVAGFAEADATKIAVGQPATITLAALSSTEVAGSVTAISPTSTVSSNVVTYDVTITLKNPPSDVLDGMTADASVVVATAENVLVVPSAAVTTTGSISTVTLLKDGKDITTTVTTGLVGSSTTEIVSGVAVGATLVEQTATVSPSSTGSGGPTGFPGGGGGLGGGLG
jgi:multidrug efflux pump subunit AcrA (membrane-fusion protein)